MLENLWKLLGRRAASTGQARDAGKAAGLSGGLADPASAAGRERAHRPNPQGFGTRTSLAKIAARKLAFDTKDGKYRMFEARSDAGIRRLLGCGPTLNVDGTPMVGDTGFDEQGKPYGVTEDFG